jgi:hypothetical protein
MNALHLYGKPSLTATTDRLALWHPTLDLPMPAAWLDWGDTPRSSAADKQFRIKNQSSALTANDVNVYIEALTPGAPSVAGMHTLSDNAGATFSASLSVVALAPGEISVPITLRRVIPANAQLSTWSARVAADVTAWS